MWGVDNVVCFLCVGVWAVFWAGWGSSDQQTYMILKSTRCCFFVALSRELEGVKITLIIILGCGNYEAAT